MLREKEFPEIWAAMVLSFLVVSNIMVIADFIDLFAPSIDLRPVSDYYSYITLILSVSYASFIYATKRHTKILNRYKEIPQVKKNILKITSIVYYFLSAYFFFLVTDLMRAQYKS